MYVCVSFVFIVCVLTCVFVDGFASIACVCVGVHMWYLCACLCLFCMCLSEFICACL